MSERTDSEKEILVRITDKVIEKMKHVYSLPIDPERDKLLDWKNLWGNWYDFFSDQIYGEEKK